ncbi:cell death abnormality protein 1-like [Ostrea edulis]|uniref:cell death abnormality protein 1-like n=1 Tax=Ostrea edulis TaxID=37623 RepID=UPI0024AFB631|nr:cell death abnormality protein 1-like [Ostrea edulis]
MSIYRGIFVMYLICKLYHCAAQSKCRSRKGDEIVCCSGYQFDVKSKECKGCAAGYFGINCSEQCPYPKYGDRCRHHCDCGIDTCDKTNGCLSISTMGPVLNFSHKYIS